MRSDGRVGLAGRRPRRVIEIGRSVVARILEIRWWFVAEIGRRLVAVKRFAAWLAAEEDLDTDGVLAVRPPKLDEKMVPSLDPDEVRRLIKACDGPTLRDKRDKARVARSGRASPGVTGGTSRQPWPGWKKPGRS